MPDFNIQDTQFFDRNFSDLIPQKRSFRHISPKLHATLQQIADNVVSRLGCVGAMVATLEEGEILPLRAYSVNISPNVIEQLEKRAGIRLLSDKTTVYLHDKKYKDNLSVRALIGHDGLPEKYIVSNQLYDLLRPFTNRALAGLAQRLTGINQVIAVPFYIDDEVVGNLFAATSSEFSERDLDFLTAFGLQAANAIQIHRQLDEMEALERVVLSLQAKITDETQVLQAVVDAVVHTLGYVGAVVATLEDNHALPIRAYTFDTGQEIIEQLEKRVGLKLIGPKAIVYLNDEQYKDNLGVRAINNHVQYLESPSLYDLLRPVVNRPLARFAQKILGIKLVLTIPFSLENIIVGNLFVLSKRATFTDREKILLETFAQQASLGVRNARLYRRAEEQNQISQMFARMAFSASAYIHTLRNHVGAFRTFLGLVQMIPELEAEQQAEVLESGEKVLDSITKSAEILDHLHEPWQQQPDRPTDINHCINWALSKLFPKLDLRNKEAGLDTNEGVMIYCFLTSDLPLIHTSSDMLTEAFRTLIKNSNEAILEKFQEGSIWITTSLVEQDSIEISIRDSGAGIPPEHINRIFEMGWSSKQGRGMGFGLFWTKDYIEGLGGAISVRSQPSKGTNFRIILPGDITLGNKDEKTISF